MNLYDRFKFFHEHAGYTVGKSAVSAYRLAVAEERAEKEGLSFTFYDEHEPWDGDCPAPKYFLWCAVYPAGRGKDFLASLGMVGVDSLNDPYLRVVEAELYAEALDVLDEERERANSAAAAELQARATYACGGAA